MKSTMPASSSDNVAQVEETLRSSLSFKNSHFDSQLAASSKRILLQKIDFKPAGKQSSFHLDGLRNKYVPLNPTSTKSLPNSVPDKMTPADSGDKLPLPKTVLYPSERLSLEWPHVRKVGVGLVNMGNTCFLNSVLQCLSYTAPLTNYMYSGHHTFNCKLPGFCMLCEFQRHIKRCFESSDGQAIRPQVILQKLKIIAKHMHWGRQEDAHEFLRYVIDAMQKSSLTGYPKLDKFSKETTVISQIFGGYLRSQVQCLRCKETSNTYDPFLDISLDIKTVSSLQRGFEKFIHSETLENDNAYNCLRCKHKVPARKHFTIHRAPNVLTIQLKRFDYHRYPANKINKHIDFPETLDLQPYMSTKQGEARKYRLYGVLVHSGANCASGHYYSFIKASNQLWYIMNDSVVSQCSINRVMNSEAYLLFYIRERLTGSANTHSQKESSMIGPQLPPNSSSVHRPQNGIGKNLNDLGTSIPRTSNGTPSSKTQANQIPLLSSRDPIKFGIKRPSKPQSNEPSKPRIVMHIKNGQVYNSKMVNGIVSSSKPHGLVPYNGNSDSGDSDQENPTVDNKPSSPIIDHSVESSASPAHTSVLISPTKLSIKLNNGTGHSPVMDKKLNATSTVPGGPLSPRRRLSTEMRSPLSRSSPLKKSVSEHGLTVNTHEIPKVKATTSWHVMHADAEVSPSVASESSAASASSTTEWQVKGKDNSVNYPIIPDAQCPGWTVSEHHALSSGVEAECNNKPVKLASDELPVKNHHIKEESPEKSNHTPVLDFNVSTNIVDNSQLNGDDTHFSKKHKKHKKHKRSHDDSDESRHKKHKHKKRSHSRDHEEESTDNDKHNKKRHLSMESSESKKRKIEYQWVEKTKDNLLEKSGQEKMAKVKEVPVYHWDQHIKDGQKGEPCSNIRRDDPRPESHTGGALSSSHEKDYWLDTHKVRADGQPKESRVDGHKLQKCASWDGMRKSAPDVVNELKKLSSSHGYGASVNSWEGGRSELDRDVEYERKRERKRHWSDQYEEELDRGKIKKVRRHYSEDHWPRHNPFQRFNDDRQRWKSGSTQHNWDRSDRPYHSGNRHDQRRSYNYY